MVTIEWKAAQDILADEIVPEVKVSVTPNRTRFTMTSIATPDKAKSEALVATYALFHIFGSSSKEEKVFLRLPPVWRDLWVEYSEIRKNQLDAADRSALGELRALVRQRRDQELEDGVILQGFRGRVAARNQSDNKDDSSQDRGKGAFEPAERLRNLWVEKSGSPKFQIMLVRFRRRMRTFNA